MVNEFRDFAFTVGKCISCLLTTVVPEEDPGQQGVYYYGRKVVLLRKEGNFSIARFQVSILFPLRHHFLPDESHGKQGVSMGSGKRKWGPQSVACWI